MKYFLLEGEHIVPFEKRARELIAAHRQFLQQGYDAGRFLLSGPSIPPKGGILIARAQTLEELKEFLANEPYCKAKVMRFSKITEFDPVQHQPILNDWFGKPQSQFPQWVRSEHFAEFGRCPLYPQKRTLTERIAMSAMCHKRTFVV